MGAIEAHSSYDRNLEGFLINNTSDVAALTFRIIFPSLHVSVWPRTGTIDAGRSLLVRVSRAASSTDTSASHHCNTEAWTGRVFVIGNDDQRPLYTRAPSAHLIQRYYHCDKTSLSRHCHCGDSRIHTTPHASRCASAHAANLAVGTVANSQASRSTLGLICSAIPGSGFFSIVADLSQCLFVCV